MLGSVAAASVSPKPGAEDPHIQTVQYDAQQVVSLRVAAGYALTLEFSQDEHIENVALGNSGAWQVMPNKAADHLFVKPSPGAPDTNMTVITDARSYNFELKALPAPEPGMAFSVRFLYPSAAAAPEQAPAEASSYRFSGARDLRPVSMSDDGEFTSIVWTPKAQIPAVYYIDPQGREALANGALRDGRFVIDQIADEFIFRLANQEARETRHLARVKH